MSATQLVLNIAQGEWQRIHRHSTPPNAIPCPQHIGDDGTCANVMLSCEFPCTWKMLNELLGVHPPCSRNDCAVRKLLEEAHVLH